jgi:hypothetical protein
MRLPRKKIVRTLKVVLTLCAAAAAHADPARFDLTGPHLEVEITRGDTTLPAAEVPNLAPGDRVWVRADLTTDESAHYLLVTTFLRGSTDPPPRAWFERCDTWGGKCAEKGLKLTVPRDAQQLLIFLAPQTGGDYKTLLDAVRGRPGAFVRTSQDLNQAQLDRSRLESYLAAIRKLGDADPARLKESAPLLSRSLGIKVDEKCLERDPLAQASCLTQGQESLILSDGHSASVTQQLTSGPASDLAMEASNAPQLRSGYYGPFIGSVLDLARLFDTLHTAQYQYIPALASTQGRQVALLLNAPPSFHDPKSVLVMALPAVTAAQFPPLRALDPHASYCVRKDPLVLPAEGAPLMFATALAHDMTLSLPAAGGKTLELPATADAMRGGFVIDTAALRTAGPSDSVVAQLHGQWGFDRYEGPSFHLVDARPQSWGLAAGEESALIVGREDVVHLHAGSVSCIADIVLQDAGGKQLAVNWKGVKADEAEVKLSLQDASPGEMTLLIRQYGSGPPQQLALRAFSEGAHLDAFTVHAGDRQGVLRGNRLDWVAKLILGDVAFVPGPLTSSNGHDELVMQTEAGVSVPTLTPGELLTAHVTLNDGRSYAVKASVAAPRPSALLIGKSAQGSQSASSGHIQLANKDELPQDAVLTFALRAQSPLAFTHEEKVEVATSDGSSSTLLDYSNGLTLQNSKIAVATLDASKTLGPSAFGPLRYRMVDDGVAGDWHALATLVRLPILRKLQCPGISDEGCTLSGTNLFLIESVSSDAAFKQPTAVPDGYTGQSLSVPRPADGVLYVKLRDDPAVVSVASLDVEGAAGRPTSALTSPPPTPSTPAAPPAAVPAAAAAPAAALPPAATPPAAAAAAAAAPAVAPAAAAAAPAASVPAGAGASSYTSAAR